MTAQIRQAPARVSSPFPIPSAPSSEGTITDFAQLWTTLWRGKWLIVLAAILGGAAAIYWALFMAEPRYRATSVVVLDAARPPVVSFSDYIPSLGPDSTLVNTELEVMRSVSLLSGVVRNQSLVTDPEFNRFLRAPPLTSRLMAALRSSLLPPVPPDDSETQARRHLNAAIDGLSNALTVRTIPDSLVFEVVVESTDPAKAARLADAIVSSYLDQQLAAKFQATQAASAWLSEKVTGLEADLETVEARRNRFAAEMDLISPETIDILTEELRSVRDTITALEDATARGSATSRTAARIAELRLTESELAEKIGHLSEDRVVLEQLEREAAASRQIYEYFLARLKETSVQEGIQQADARLMSAALIPDLPASPRPSLDAALGATLAAIAAAVALVVAEMRSATFRTAEDLEAATGLVVMGQIPTLPVSRRPRVLDHVRRKPSSAGVEAIRNLRTALMMSGGDRPPKVIMCTSSLPSEGKTTQTLALAQTMAGLQKRVLVIEGDLRKRVFGDYFPTTQDPRQARPSYLSVMRGKRLFADAVHPIEGAGFDVLLGEETRINPADIFASAAFRRLIAEARNTYDIVLIDTPPVLLVPDARVIGRLADTTLYTVRWDKTRLRQVQAGLQMLRTVGITVGGLVLSQINPRKLRRYGYGKDYGAYGNSGYYSN